MIFFVGKQCRHVLIRETEKEIESDWPPSFKNPTITYFFGGEIRDSIFFDHSNFSTRPDVHQLCYLGDISQNRTYTIYE